MRDSRCAAVILCRIHPVALRPCPADSARAGTHPTGCLPATHSAHRLRQPLPTNPFCLPSGARPAPNPVRP